MQTERFLGDGMSEVTGTKNWTSHCGADFSFLDTYLREKEALPSVRRSTRAEMNKGVLQAYEHIQNVHASHVDELLREVNQDIDAHNTRVLEKHNINPNDGIPAYVDRELRQPVTELEPTGKQLMEDERQYHLSELYDAVRKDGLDSYLSDDVMQVLNSDSFSYQKYDEEQSMAEYYEQERAEARLAQSKPVPNRDYSKGFALDDAGQMIDDGYGFEEYD